MVITATDHLALSINDHSAYRNFSCGQGFSGFLQGFRHKLLVHSRMLNYSAMKSLGMPILLMLLLCPISALGQGVRMSADFFPLDVGKRWTYEVTNESGQKVGELSFNVEEYTIVS